MAANQNIAQLQADMAALQQLVNNQAATIAQQQIDVTTAQGQATQAAAAAAAAQAAIAAGPALGNVPPAVVQTTNTPGQAIGVIDMQSVAGAKLFKSASAPFVVKFDGQSARVTAFINDLSYRATNFGWNTSIFTIICADGTAKNMLTNYSSITMEDIETMATAYSGIAPVATRGSQSAAQLHALLQDSLTPELKDRVIARRAEYTFNINQVAYEDGVAMLKVVFNLVSVDTRATIAVIDRNLSEVRMTNKLGELEYDLIKFHLFINEQILALNQRNVVVKSVVASLFETYLTVPDDAFTTWAKQQYSNWEDPNTDDYTNEQVMNMAEVKFNTILQKGEWKVPSKKDGEIIALKAQLEQAVAQLADTPKKKIEPNSSGGNGKQRGAGKSTDKFAWKLVAPKEGESHEKHFDGKDYVYCPNHDAIKWVLKSGHAGGCRNAPKKKEADSSDHGQKASDKVKEDMIKALASIVGDSE